MRKASNILFDFAFNLDNADCYPGTKRKASEEVTTPDSKQRSKKARTESPEREEKEEKVSNSQIHINCEPADQYRRM